MLRGNWHRAITAAVAVFIAFCLFMTGLDSGHRQQQIQDANEQQASTPDQLEANCSSLAGVELVRCVAGQVEAQREARHDAYDLVAQQQSATWATVAALAAVAGFVATVIGLFFVWQSLSKTNEALRLTREANKTTREIGEKQVAVYLACTGADFGLGETNVWITFHIKNFGQSPARWARITGSLVVINEIGAMPAMLEHPLGSAETGPVVVATEETALLHASDGDKVPANTLPRVFRFNMVPLMCDCVLEWEDVFGHVGTLRFNVMEDMPTTKIENVETVSNKTVLMKKGQMKPTSHPTPATK